MTNFIYQNLIAKMAIFKKIGWFFETTFELKELNFFSFWKLNTKLKDKKRRKNEKGKLTELKSFYASFEIEFTKSSFTVDQK